MAPVSVTPNIPDRLRLYILGSFRVERNAQTIHFSTRKIESLFAFLALHPEQHRREQLATLLWGNSTDELARRSLRTALAVIRKELGNDILLADRETVQFNPDFLIWIDAREFQSALDLYQGDLLTDFYDDWILAERERLRGQYLNAVLQLTQDHRSKSEYARAVELAHQVLATDRANEKAYQHIIFCLAATGDRAQALKQYAECERVLRTELDVAPSRETTALCAQIQAEMTGGQAREAWLTNLPAPLTSFVGRHNEIADVKHLLESARLVTLLGAGGCGKTRLAIQVGTDLAAGQCFKHGVWWVDLSALQDPAHVLDSVATVFDLRESETLPILSLVTNYLRTKELLLILDNCEQLIDACAQLAGTLLSACPKLRVLATSRERLNASGEFVWYVPSMAIPQTELPLDQLQQYDAIQLFAERGRAVVSHWSLVGHGATVTHICAQLDGIPLAIELAATRLSVLSAEQIDARLADRFNLLSGGSRTELPRHQTLRAAIDWSYELLPEAERVAYRQLSVFAGGWTLEAAEAVVSGNALDFLTALAGKSLVVVEQKEDTTRYRFLETIRQYAREKLEASSELQPAQDRHLHYFLKLAEDARPQLLNGDPTMLNRVEIEYDNMRAALEHSLATNPELALRLAMALEWFWEWHNRVKEGYAWVTRLLPLTEAWGPGKLRARALGLAGGLAGDVPDRAAALAFTEASLEMARAAGDKYRIAWSLHDLAVQSMRSGDWEQMRVYTKEGLALFEELDIQWGVQGAFYQLGAAAEGSGDYEAARLFYEQSLERARKENIPVGISWTLDSLGGLALRRGDCASAKELYSESIQISRQMGHKATLAPRLVELGQIALQQGDYVRARALFEESLAIQQQMRYVHGPVKSLAGFAGVAAIAGRHQLAAQLFGAVEATHELLGSKMSPLAHLVYDPIVDQLREQLGQETFDAAWQAGHQMPLESAIEYALEHVRKL